MKAPTKLIALGVPGQATGQATLPNDRGDETQALFMYQWSAGVVILAGALTSQNQYVGLWCEHHDDILAELPTGQFHAVQVKTTSKQGATWKCSDSGFIDAIKKFTEHEAQYSLHIEKYIFFSNAKPYIPGAAATLHTTLAGSPMRVRDACIQATDSEHIPAPYKDSFDAIVNATQATPAMVFHVLRKLEFQLGLPLEGFREHLGLVVGGIPVCQQFIIAKLNKLRDDLLYLVGKASSLEVPALQFYASILQVDGRPAATVRSKHISVEEFFAVLNQNVSEDFRYAEVGGYLQLGKASGQKNVLRKKMNAGFVGNYFDAIWLQAMAAERRLMERAIKNPSEALRITKQLEGVMLVECRNAEASAALEADERRRGLLVYQRILNRTEELSNEDKATVENERPETLRGVAGLLSGSCKFAWGLPIDLGGEDGA